MQTVDRGDPINEGFNPVSSLFPLSTVTLETPGSPGCTGVILSDTKILTAAHCKPGPTTTVRLYGTTAGSGALIAGPPLPPSTSVAVEVQPGVVCDPTVTGSVPDTCYTGSGSARHYADLAVVTLDALIPAPYVPVALGPRGSFTANYGKKTSWQVATGGGGAMRWAPTYYALSNNDNVGYFTMTSPFGLPGDTGGPVYQYATNTTPVASGVYNLILLGLTSTIGPDQGGSATSNTHVTTYTSVVYPDNYDWIIGQGGAAASDVATFGSTL
jgi:hypothetical protein